MKEFPRKLRDVFSRSRTPSPSPSPGGSSARLETAKEALVLALGTAKDILEAFPVLGAQLAVGTVLGIIKRIDVSSIVSIVELVFIHQSLTRTRRITQKYWVD